MADQLLSNRLFKKLSTGNWREVDRTGSHIVRFKVDGTSEPLYEDDWASQFLKYQLSEKSPQRHWESVRGRTRRLLLRLLFLSTLHVGKRAAIPCIGDSTNEKAHSARSAKKISRYVDALNWMKEEGILSEGRYMQWNASRYLRNSFSHADKQSLFDQTMAFSNLAVAVELINELFDDG